MITRKAQSTTRPLPSENRGSQSSVPRSHPSSTAIDMPSSDDESSAPDWWADRYSIVLLIALYAAQGLPMGLAFGSIPFLLKERGSSYADLARFSFASLPYSLKLFIAPVVDSLYSRAFGRRKSWIVPVQLSIGLTMTLTARRIQSWVASGNVNMLTPMFILLLALTATQDIAVDGWSLTMLRKSNVSYASTCQSLGLSIGYFSTFTVFLAFSNSNFCDNYVRPLMFFSSGTGAVVDLGSALRSAGLYYLFLTIYITLFKHETWESNSTKKTDDDIREPKDISDFERVDLCSSVSVVRSSRSRSVIFDSIAATYSDLLVITKKPAVRSFVSVLLISKVGFSAYDNVAPLKLLELGFSKESMASMAVLQTPFTLLGTIITGRLVANRSPLEVYLYGYFLRFMLSLSGPACISYLKSQNGAVTTSFYLLILSLTILYSFASECLMFVGVGAFFLNISTSSNHVGGSYLTLLNTSSNMGGTWHKALTLWMVDRLTWREDCVIPPGSPASTVCPMLYDGYYVISFALIPVTALVGVHFLRILPRLGKLPDSSWRASL